MKKLDKLILSSFLGPFFLTYLVVVFILLTQHMLKYFDDLVGKGLGWEVIGKLLFYFSIFMTPIAMPLAILLSSLMTFGNLGEHFELTAIKSSGISLLRALRPIFGFVLILTVFAFYSNNYFVPKAALKAYSLLYDIKQKKPALDLKEGAFYGGIPDFSIKVSKKFPDGESLKDIIFYDHRNKDGNKDVTLADSGRMYTFMDERYLMFELFDGHSYKEGKSNTSSVPNQRGKPESLGRYSFKQSKIVLDLSSFDLKRTKEALFARNRIMRNLNELTSDADSVQRVILSDDLGNFQNYQRYSSSYQKQDSILLPGELLAFKVLKDSLDSLAFVDGDEDEDKKWENGQMSEDLKKEMKEKEKGDTVTSKAPNKQRTDVKNQKLPKKLDIKKPNKPAIKTGKPAIAKKSKSRPLTKSQKVETKDEDKNDLEEDKLIAGTDPEEGLPKIDSLQDKTVLKGDTINEKSREEIFDDFIASNDREAKTVSIAVNQVRQVKSKLSSHVSRIENLKKELYIFQIQWHKIWSNSLACIIMFLIGAPLGAIIKRGGLGVPVLLSIVFFIIFYVLNMTGEKWAKQGAIDVAAGVWSANAILLPFGLFFLRQARNDARLFEADFYHVVFDKVKGWFNKGENKDK